MNTTERDVVNAMHMRPRERSLTARDRSLSARDFKTIADDVFYAPPSNDQFPPWAAPSHAGLTAALV